MEQLIRIRSLKEYWDDFIVPGVKGDISPETVKRRVTDAFRREMFDQMMLRLKVTNLGDAPETNENKRIVENIFKQTLKKWNGLVDRCAMFKETRDFLKPDDLKWDDDLEAVYNGKIKEDASGNDPAEDLQKPGEAVGA